MWVSETNAIRPLLCPKSRAPHTKTPLSDPTLYTRQLAPKCCARLLKKVFRNGHVRKTASSPPRAIFGFLRPDPPDPSSPVPDTRPDPLNSKLPDSRPLVPRPSDPTPPTLYLLIPTPGPPRATFGTEIPNLNSQTTDPRPPTRPLAPNTRTPDPRPPDHRSLPDPRPQILDPRYQTPTPGPLTLNGCACI